MQTKKPEKLPPQYLWKTLPEILYEEASPNEKPNPIPYIEVPKEMKMPPVLFIFEYHHTGEYEPDEKGNPQEVLDQIPHKYINYEFLMSRISNPVVEDKIRLALGMETLAEAKKKGAKVLEAVLGKTNQLKEDLIASQPERLQAMKDRLEQNQ